MGVFVLGKQTLKYEILNFKKTNTQSNGQLLSQNSYLLSE
jgi:hypothetical protein